MLQVAAIEFRPMAHDELGRQSSVKLSPSHSSPPEATSPAGAPSPGPGASSAEFRRTLRVLTVIAPISAASFGGALVIMALLTTRRRHPPADQSTLVIISLCGLPRCSAEWAFAWCATRQLRGKRNQIQRRDKPENRRSPSRKEGSLHPATAEQQGSG